MLEIAFRPDRGLREPLYRQLADYLRDLVESGHLAAGQKLPATRELAGALGLSRNTVNLAYEALSDARLVTAHVGQGTFVAPGGVAAEAAALAAGAPAGEGFAWEGLFATRTRRRLFPAVLREEARPVALPYDFRPGRVDPGSLPHADVRRAFARAVDDSLVDLANQLDPFGWAPLREEIARTLVARGIRCDPAEVMVVEGAQQALDLLGRVLIDPGDAVAVEDPGYFGARLAFGAREADLLPIPVDAGGLRTDALARVLRTRRLKAVYTTPAVQAPTGVALAEDRRRDLLALAESHQTPIIEDDYDCELRLAGSLAPALKRDDTAGRVLYLGTFSKALFPALRLGYLVAARPLLQRAAAAQLASHFGGNLLAQAALAQMLRSGALERHVRRVRRLYAERLEAMLEALASALPEDARVVRPAGGNGVWVELPDDVDGAALALDALEAGIGYGRGEGFFAAGDGAHCLFLSFASTGPDAIGEGVARLGGVIERRRARGARRIQ